MQHLLQKYKNQQPLTEQEKEQFTIALLEAQGRSDRRKKWQLLLDKIKVDTVEDFAHTPTSPENIPTNAPTGSNITLNVKGKYFLGLPLYATLRAAAVLVGMFLAWQVYTTFTNNSLNEQIAQHLITQYTTPQTRMGNLAKQTPEDVLWEQALLYYNEKHYSKTQQTIEQLLQKDPKNVQYLFYNALSQVYQTHYEQALQSFAQIEQLQSPMYQYETIWYQALAHLKLQQWDKAKTKLNQLIKSPTNYSRSAQQLLDKMLKQKL